MARYFAIEHMGGCSKKLTHPIELLEGQYSVAMALAKCGDTHCRVVEVEAQVVRKSDIIRGQGKTFPQLNQEFEAYRNVRLKEDWEARHAVELQQGTEKRDSKEARTR